MTGLGTRHAPRAASFFVALWTLTGCGEDAGEPADVTGGTTGVADETGEGDTTTSDTSDEGSTSSGASTGRGTSGGEDSSSSSSTTANDDGCAAGPPIHCVLEALTAPYIDTSGSEGKAIGLVVGVATPDGRYITGFGATEPGGDTPPAADSMLELASISKVYTGYLLARALGEGEVTLGDTLEDTFGPAVPTFEGQSISLLDLATHTSGLPDYPTNVPNPGPINPMVGYTLQLLQEFFASYTLEVAPSTTYEYSNLGSGTLGHILTTAAGLDAYADLTEQRIAAPRGFVDTVVELDDEQQGRWMQMYQGGRPIPPLAMGEVLYGGGILRSTASEVLDFFGEAIEGSDPTWGPVLEPYRPGLMGFSTGLQIGVEDLGDHARYSKGGATAGMVMFTTDPPALVFVQTNVRGVDGLRTMATELLEGLEGVPLE